MRKCLTLSFVFVLSFQCPPEMRAGAFATEFTQLLNHGQMVMSYIRQGTQLSNELSMYAEQMRNGQALPSHIYGTINTDLTALSSIPLHHPNWFFAARKSVGGIVMVPDGLLRLVGVKPVN